MKRNNTFYKGGECTSLFFKENKISPHKRTGRDLSHHSPSCAGGDMTGFIPENFG